MKFGGGKKKKKHSLFKIVGVLAFFLSLIATVVNFFIPSHRKKAAILQFKSAAKQTKKAASTASDQAELAMSKSKKLFAWTKKAASKTGSKTWDTFVPNALNDYKPKALRPNALKSYATILILAKVLITGTLFFLYPTPGHLSDVVVKKVIEFVNVARNNEGVDQLTINSTLTAAAQAKLDDMIGSGYFSHDSPDGRKPWNFINRNQYDYLYAGENLAMDFATAKVVHEAFMASPSHRKNIINKNYTHIGVAMGTGYIDGRFTTLLVQMFGSPKAPLAASGPQPASVPSPSEEETQPAPEPTPVESAPVVEEERVADARDLQPSVQPEPTSVEGVDVTNVSPQAEPTKVVVVSESLPENFLGELIQWSQRLYLWFVVFLIFSLLINIFVHVRIQNSRIILQSVVVIILGGLLWFTNVHFLENVAHTITIL